MSFLDRLRQLFAPAPRGVTLTLDARIKRFRGEHHDWIQR